MSLTCECDADCTGDPLRFVKCSHYCPVHDECEGGCGRMGSVQDPTFGKPSQYEPRAQWLCSECCQEAIKEATEQADYSDNPAIHAANLAARKSAILDAARERHFSIHDRGDEV